MIDRVAGIHKLCLVLDEAFTFSELYGRTIGQGTTFCANHNFKVNKHMKLSKGMITEDNLYVLRNRKSDFTLPTILSYELEGDVVDIWIQDAQSLDN